MWRRRAVTIIKAELPSGKASKTLVHRPTSRKIRSSGLLVLIRNPLFFAKPNLPKWSIPNLKIMVDRKNRFRYQAV